MSQWIAPNALSVHLVGLALILVAQPLEVGDEGGDAVTEIAEPHGELPGRPALVHVRVPSANVGKRHLEPHAAPDELRDLPQALAERRPRILRAVRREVALRVGRLEQLDRLEHLAPRGMHQVGRPGAIQGLEPCGRGAARAHREVT